MVERNVLFVGDASLLQHAYCEEASPTKLAVEVCTAAAAISAIGSGFGGVLVIDLRNEPAGGLDLLRQVHELATETPVVVVVTNENDIAIAVNAMRLGAYDVVERPFDPRRMLDSILRASEKWRLTVENRHLRFADISAAAAARIVGVSRATEKLRANVAELALTDASVVIYGETGVGKDLAARCLHDLGPRAKGNYVAVNCAAVPETLVESEFFGHEAGAFTGSMRPRAGRIEHADRGTLFLDEIDSMPLLMQGKLLRVLEERCVERLGSNQRIKVDFRLIAASKMDLQKAHTSGTFRPDLYFRLCVAELHIPPLRARRDDILPLFHHFAALAERTYKRERRALTALQSNKLMRHDWAGNIRELRNAAERFVLGFDRDPYVLSIDRPQSLTDRIDAFEKAIIERCLMDSGGQISRVMEKLGIPRRTLNDKMARFGLQRKEYAAADLHGSTKDQSNATVAGSATGEVERALQSKKQIE